MFRISVLFFAVCLCLTTVSMAQSWSPQKAELLFSSGKSGNGEIYIQKFGTNEWVNLSNHPDGDNWPAWSPDGKRIVFQKRTAGYFNLWVVNADGSNLKQLTDHPDHEYLASWTPDGKSITFTSWRKEPADTGRAPHIYIMNADGSNQRRLVEKTLNQSAECAWSPDGKHIAYSRKVSETAANIFIADSDGKNERQLTYTEEVSGSPVFSPDGTQIAFYFDTGNGAQIATINLDGTGRTVLVAEGYNWYPKWSPDGQWITYTAYAPGEDKNLDIFAIHVSGKEKPIAIASSPAREQESSWKPAPISK